MDSRLPPAIQNRYKLRERRLIVCIYPAFVWQGLRREWRSEAMAEKSKILTGVRRGLGLRCPQCGEGRLFARFLKVRGRCEACGADNTIYPSDDAPPYLTLFLVGHLVFPFMFWMDKAWS